VSGFVKREMMISYPGCWARGRQEVGDLSAPFLALLCGVGLYRIALRSVILTSVPHPPFTERKQAQELEVQKSLKRAAAAAPVAPAGTPADGRPAKKAATGLKSTNAAAAPSIPDEYLPPNKVLFLQKLPADANQEMLSGLFGRFDGFKEVRMVPGRKGIAFVEYEHQEGAISAKEAMAGAVLVTGADPIKVTYQRQ